MSGFSSRGKTIKHQQSSSAIEMDRRQILAAGGGLLLAGLLPMQQEAWAKAKAVYASAIRQPDGTFAAALLDETGKPIAIYPLEDRGHDITIHKPTGQCVAFARRPGRFMLAFDGTGKKQGKDASQLIWSREDRHYFGHGVFSADGTRLFATENNFDDGHGVIGIYDVKANFKRIGEFHSGGIGPHDILLMPDQKTLVVANGGILTHPDYRRIKLNLDDMKPNLSFIDLKTGDIKDQMELSQDLHQLSIRHLAIDGTGAVWFGCQHQGERTEEVPLVGSYKPGQDAKLHEIPEDIFYSLRNYIGSLAANKDGSIIATSSPRGSKTLFWDVKSGSYIGMTPLRDGCGVAPAKQGFALSSGIGHFGQARLPGEDQFDLTSNQAGLAFDNHMVAF